LIDGGDEDGIEAADDPSKLAYWLRGLEEASARFEGLEAPGLDSYAALYRSVLVNYGFRCALTGAEAATGAPADGLQVCPIRPRDAGGALHVSNFLCLSPAADRAFAAGHLTVGPGLEIIVDLSRVDPELLQALNANGRLALPVDATGLPDTAALAFHRSHIFLRP
jgi:predicted restriction endonuclease